MADWARVVNTTTRKFIKGETVEVLRQRILLAILNDRGRITFNNHGTEMQWQVRYRQAPLQGFDDADTITFSRQRRWKNGVLPVRGYLIPDSMTKREKLLNDGVEALVKVYSSIAENLMEDLEEQFGDQLYIDGNATGNQKLFHGIESFLGYSGLVAGGNAYVGAPDSTYAGLSTALGNYSGAWSDPTVWPTGNGTADYDFWSPTIVDFTNANWPQSTKTWPNTCLDALRFMILHSQKNKAKRGKLDLVTLDRELYRQFVSRLQLEERLQISPNEGSSGAWKLGFTNMQNFDGTDITWEFGSPAGVGYGWAMDNVELMSWQPELFVAEGPILDPASQSWRWWVDCYGNLKFKSIRNFGKLVAIS